MAAMNCWLLLLGLGVAAALYGGEEKARAATTTCNCGWANRGRMVGGAETLANEYPLIVSLQLRPTPFRNSFLHNCGGSIISPWHILTAAHCVGFLPEDMYASVGAHNIKSAQQKRIPIAEIFEHPLYDPTTTVNDIAILKTALKIDFNQNVGPACLPLSKVNLDNQPVRNIGWGKLSTLGPASDTLQVADFRVVDDQTCADIYKNNRPHRPSDSTICFSDSNNKDICMGDSGGPLMWFDPEINRYTVVGVNSFTFNCTALKPSVATAVGVYTTWINEIVASTGDQLCYKVAA